MKKTILILVLLAAVVGGCNKEKQTLKKIYGDYTLKKYTMNGVDSLTQFKDSMGTNFSFYNDANIDRLNLRITGARNDGVQTLFDCAWGLKNDNQILQIKKLICCMKCMGPFGNENDIDWEIIKLRNGYFILKTTYNNKEYEIELE